MPSAVISIPPEKVLKTPPPYPSGLATRNPARTIIHKPKRMKVNENISDMSTSMLAAKAAVDAAKTEIKMPSERTPTGLFGIEPHNLYVELMDIKSFVQKRPNLVAGMSPLITAPVAPSKMMLNLSPLYS